MKKIFGVLLVLFMMCEATACGTKSDVETTTVSESVREQEKEKTEPERTAATELEDTDLNNKEDILKVVGQQIYFSYPENWATSQNGKTTAIFSSDECLVGVCYDWITEFDGTLEEIPDLFADSFGRDTVSICRGDIGTSSIEVLTTERTTVAGMESVRFTGTIKNNSWDCHLYGYTYQVNGVNLMVVGLVSAQEQNSDMIAEIDTLTDQIAASVRTEE